jgi:hypothetical protein
MFKTDWADQKKICICGKCQHIEPFFRTDVVDN